MGTPSRAGSRAGRRSFLAGVAGAAGLALLPRRRTASAAFGPRAKLRIDGAKEVVAGDDGTVAYVATTDGFATVDVSDPAEPTVLARIDDVAGDHLDGSIETVWDVGVDGDRLVVAGPAVFAHDSPERGFAVFDVSDPADPRRTGVRGTDHGIHNAFVDGDLVYVTRRTGGDTSVRIFDVADGEPAEIGSFSPADHGAWHPEKLHDVYVADGTMYACYWDLGTWVVDVADPTDPQPLVRVGFDQVAEPESSRSELPGNAHYAQPAPESAVLAVGKEAWDDPDTAFEGHPGGIELWDLRDPTSPSRETILAPPPATEGRATGTAHNFGWRGDRLYASWNGGGVEVYEVPSAADPALLAGWRDDERGDFWTAKPIHDGFVATSTLTRIVDEEGPPPGLVTFPEPSGVDPRPVRELEPLAPADNATFDGVTQLETPTEPPAGSPDGATATETGISVPGFGAAGALTAAGGAAWRLLWCDRDG